LSNLEKSNNLIVKKVAGGMTQEKIDTRSVERGEHIGKELRGRQVIMRREDV